MSGFGEYGRRVATQISRHARLKTICTTHRRPSTRFVLLFRVWFYKRCGYDVAICDSIARIEELNFQRRCHPDVLYSVFEHERQLRNREQILNNFREVRVPLDWQVRALKAAGVKAEIVLDPIPPTSFPQNGNLRSQTDENNCFVYQILVVMSSVARRDVKSFKRLIHQLQYEKDLLGKSLQISVKLPPSRAQVNLFQTIYSFDSGERVSGGAIRTADIQILLHPFRWTEAHLKTELSRCDLLLSLDRLPGWDIPLNDARTAGIPTISFHEFFDLPEQDDMFNKYHEPVLNPWADKDLTGLSWVLPSEPEVKKLSSEICKILGKGQEV